MRRLLLLVPFGGRQVVKGMNGLTNAQITDYNKGQAVLNAQLKGFIK